MSTYSVMDVLLILSSFMRLLYFAFSQYSLNIAVYIANILRNILSISKNGIFLV